MRSVTLSTAIAVGLILQGCGSVVLPTAVKLMTLSPLEADPAGFEVALGLPENLGIAPGSARLTFVSRNLATDEVQSGEFRLIDSGDALRLFRVDPADVPEMRRLQALAKAGEDADPDKHEGSIGIHLAPCAMGEGPESDATVDVSIRLAEGGPMLPLIRRGPINAVTEGIDMADLPQCRKDG